MTSARLDHSRMIRRAAAELRPGEAVALGPGLPALLPAQLPSSNAVWFLADNGVLGYQAGAPHGTPNAIDANGDGALIAPGGAFTGVVDVAGMLRGGHVGLAVLQAAQVSARGDLVHWTTAATPGLAAPGSAVDLASGAGRVVAVMPHSGTDGSPNILGECALPVDGIACVSLIITDVAVIAVGADGLALTELAPGWTPRRSHLPHRRAAGGVAHAAGNDLRHANADVARQSLPDCARRPAGRARRRGGERRRLAGPGGMAQYLLTGLRDQGAKGLTIISNTAGIARVVSFGTPEGMTPIDHSILVENNQIGKSIASYPVSPSASRPSAFEEAYNRGDATLEVVPQALWPSGCAPAARAWRPSTPPPPSARCWVKARNCAKSRAGSTCWSTASGPISASSGGTRPTPWATWSTRAPPVTSTP